MDEAIFSKEEIEGILVMISRFLISGLLDNPIEQRAIGRLLSDCAVSVQAQVS